MIYTVTIIIMFIPYEIGQEVYFQDMYTKAISKGKIETIMIREN